MISWCGTPISQVWTDRWFKCCRSRLQREGQLRLGHDPGSAQRWRRGVRYRSPFSRTWLLRSKSSIPQAWSETLLNPSFCWKTMCLLRLTTFQKALGARGDRLRSLLMLTLFCLVCPTRVRIRAKPVRSWWILLPDIKFSLHAAVHDCQHLNHKRLHLVHQYPGYDHLCTVWNVVGSHAIYFNSKGFAIAYMMAALEALSTGLPLDLASPVLYKRWVETFIFPYLPRESVA